MRDKTVVQYPSTIRKMFLPIYELFLRNPGIASYALARLIKGSDLPKGTLYRQSNLIKSETGERPGIEFSILNPNGVISSGIALLKPSEPSNPRKAVMIAAGRAIACYKAKCADVMPVPFSQHRDALARWQSVVKALAERGQNR